MDDLEQRIKALESGHRNNRNKIENNRSAARFSLAVIVFVLTVWGIPIASVKWNDDEFQFTRDTAKPELVLLGGLIAASLFVGEKPLNVLNSILNKK